MIKKIFHISDIHIRTFQHHELYRKVFNTFFNDVKEKTKELSIDEVRIVITGDLAHQKINISNEQMLLTAWILSELSKLGKVILIPGNHDFLENNMERIDSITPVVEMLNNPRISYFKDSGVYKDENVNWVVYSLYQHNQRPSFNNTDDKVYIGLFHGQIQGISTDLGFVFEDGYDKLNFLGCDIVLCGDIHKRQTFKLSDGTNGYMIGSMIQQDTAETIKHHGYGLYDIDENKYTFHDVPNDQPYLHFLINDINDIENEREILINLG